MAKQTGERVVQGVQPAVDLFSFGSMMATGLLLLVAPAFAQEMPLPYAQGNVNRFLEANKAKKLPSVVLYNFNLESG